MNKQSNEVVKSLIAMATKCVLRGEISEARIILSSVQGERLIVIEVNNTQSSNPDI